MSRRFAICFVLPALAVSLSSCAGGHGALENDDTGSASDAVVASGWGLLYSPDPNQMFWNEPKIYIHGKCTGVYADEKRPFAALPIFTISSAGDTPRYEQSYKVDSIASKSSDGTGYVNATTPPPGRYTIAQRCYTNEEIGPRVTITVNAPQAKIDVPTTEIIDGRMHGRFTGSCTLFPVNKDSESPYSPLWTIHPGTPNALAVSSKLSMFHEFLPGQSHVELQCIDRTGKVVSKAQHVVVAPAVRLEATILSEIPNVSLPHHEEFELSGSCRGAIKRDDGTFEWKGARLDARWVFRPADQQVWTLAGHGYKLPWRPRHAHGRYSVRFECVSTATQSEVLSVSPIISVVWKPRGRLERLWFGRDGEQKSARDSAQTSGSMLHTTHVTERPLPPLPTRYATTPGEAAGSFYQALPPDYEAIPGLESDQDRPTSPETGR